MKLTYRGIQYNSANPVQVSNGTVIGKYRGIPVQLVSPVSARSSESGLVLRYRGIDY